MRCACGDSPGDMSLCERHAIEFRKRWKAEALMLIEAGNAVEYRLRSLSPKLTDEDTKAIFKWMQAIVVAKEAFGGSK